jgi:serine/threonine protein kinase
MVRGLDFMHSLGVIHGDIKAVGSHVYRADNLLTVDAIR